jgi:hypothetical protein
MPQRGIESYKDIGTRKRTTQQSKTKLKEMGNINKIGRKMTHKSGDGRGMPDADFSSNRSTKLRHSMPQFPIKSNQPKTNNTKFLA